MSVFGICNAEKRRETDKSGTREVVDARSYRIVKGDARWEVFLPSKGRKVGACAVRSGKHEGWGFKVSAESLETMRAAFRPGCRIRLGDEDGATYMAADGRRYAHTSLLPLEL